MQIWRRPHTHKWLFINISFRSEQTNKSNDKRWQRILGPTQFIVFYSILFDIVVNLLCWTEWQSWTNREMVKRSFGSKMIIPNESKTIYGSQANDCHWNLEWHEMTEMKINRKTWQVVKLLTPAAPERIANKSHPKTFQNVFIPKKINWTMNNNKTTENGNWNGNGNWQQHYKRGCKCTTSFNQIKRR